MYPSESLSFNRRIKDYDLSLPEAETTKLNNTEPLDGNVCPGPFPQDITLQNMSLMLSPQPTFKRPFSKRQERKIRLSMFDSVLKDSEPETPEATEFRKPFAKKKKTKKSIDESNNKSNDNLFDCCLESTPGSETSFVVPSNITTRMRKRTTDKRVHGNDLFSQYLDSSDSDHSFVADRPFQKQKKSKNQTVTAKFEEVLEDSIRVDNDNSISNHAVPFKNINKAQSAINRDFDDALQDSSEDSISQNFFKPFQNRKYNSNIHPSIFDNALEDSLENTSQLNNSTFKRKPFKKQEQKITETSACTEVFDNILEDSLDPTSNQYLQNSTNNTKTPEGVSTSLSLVSNQSTKSQQILSVSTRTIDDVLEDSFDKTYDQNLQLSRNNKSNTLESVDASMMSSQSLKTSYTKLPFKKQQQKLSVSTGEFDDLLEDTLNATDITDSRNNSGISKSTKSSIGSLQLNKSDHQRIPFKKQLPKLSVSTRAFDDALADSLNTTDEQNRSRNISKTCNHVNHKDHCNELNQSKDGAENESNLILQKSTSDLSNEVLTERNYSSKPVEESVSTELLKNSVSNAKHIEGISGGESVEDSLASEEKSTKNSVLKTNLRKSTSNILLNEESFELSENEMSLNISNSGNNTESIVQLDSNSFSKKSSLKRAKNEIVEQKSIQNKQFPSSESKKVSFTFTEPVDDLSPKTKSSQFSIPIDKRDSLKPKPKRVSFFLEPETSKQVIPEQLENFSDCWSSSAHLSFSKSLDSAVDSPCIDLHASLGKSLCETSQISKSSGCDYEKLEEKAIDRETLGEEEISEREQEETLEEEESCQDYTLVDENSEIEETLHEEEKSEQDGQLSEEELEQEKRSELKETLVENELDQEETLLEEETLQKDSEQISFLQGRKSMSEITKSSEPEQLESKEEVESEEETIESEQDEMESEQEEIESDQEEIESDQEEMESDQEEMESEKDGSQVETVESEQDIDKSEQEQEELELEGGLAAEAEPDYREEKMLDQDTDVDNQILPESFHAHQKSHVSPTEDIVRQSRRSMNSSIVAPQKIISKAVFKEPKAKIPSKRKVQEILDRIPLSELKKKKRKTDVPDLTEVQTDHERLEEDLTRRQGKGSHACKDSLTNKLKRPVKWIYPGIYKFVIDKISSQFGIKSRVRAQNIVDSLGQQANKIMKGGDVIEIVGEMKDELAYLGIVRTHLDFYLFVRKYFDGYLSRKLYPSNGKLGGIQEEDSYENIL